MKKNSKIFAVSIITLCLLAAGFGIVKATNSNANNPLGNLVSAIAQRFGLNENDVQTVFNEHWTQMNAEREARRTEMEARAQEGFTERINRAVTDGKLTQEQANLIIAKMTELRTQTQEELQNQTREERRAEMQERMETLKQWMIDNNIPQEICPMGFGIGEGPGGFGGHGRGGMFTE